MPSPIQLSDVVAIILQAANRPMTITELADTCWPYVGELVSYFEVKQSCLHLFKQKKVLLDSSEPLTFSWLTRAEP